MTKVFINVIIILLAILNGGVLLHELALFDEMMSLSDEELVSHCSKSEVATTIIISRYKNIIIKKAQARARFEHEVDDLVQDGLMALISAVSTYKADYGTKFSTYANTCIENRMKNSLSKTNNDNKVLYHSNEFVDDFTDITPESILIEKEKTQELYSKIINILSEKEWNVFRLFLTGSTYDQMARQLNLPLKVVDNAMQRVRRKLKTVWRADKFN